MFFFPSEQNNPTYSPARVVKTLVILNTLVFLACAFGADSYLTLRFAFIPSSVQWPTFFSYMFLHAGFWHLFGNMAFLYMFGDNVEDVLGHIGFAITYIICGVGSALGYWLMNAQSTVPMVGASGAISGVIAIYVICFPSAPFKLHIFIGRWDVASRSITAKGAILIWFCEQLLLAVLTSMTHLIGIAFWAHIGGFIMGGLVGIVVRVLGFKDRYNIRRTTVIAETQRQVEETQKQVMAERIMKRQRRLRFRQRKGKPGRLLKLRKSTAAH